LTKYLYMSLVYSYLRDTSYSPTLSDARSKISLATRSKSWHLRNA